MQFFKIDNRWVSWEEIQKKRKLKEYKRVTKMDIRNEKIRQLRHKAIEISHTITAEDLDALCKEYKVDVNETTILNKVK